MKLHLGFENLAYGSAAARRVLSHKERRRSHYQSYGQGKTTGEVSKTLEERYKIVDAFYDLEEDYIIELIEERAAMDLDAILTMNEPSRTGISFKETDLIEKRFVENIKKRRYDSLIGGVPTEISKREARPSFFKTGLYSSSFRAWMEE